MIPRPVKSCGTSQRATGFRFPCLCSPTASSTRAAGTAVVPSWRFGRVAPGASPTATSCGECRRAGRYVSSLVHYDGLIYMMGDVGVLTVTDAKTGSRVFQDRLGGVYSASPVAADGKIYLLSESGETIVLAAGRTPRVLARNQLSARQLASPAIAGGRLFIRSDDALYAIGQ